MPGWLIREVEGGSPTYVPSEANTVLLAEALRVPVGPLLREREQLFEQWDRPDVVGLTGGQALFNPIPWDLDVSLIFYREVTPV